MITPVTKKQPTTEVGDLLDVYYEELSRVVVLDKDLEFKYMEEYSNSETSVDRKNSILKAVIESNLKLVFSLAKNLWQDKNKETLQELISAGNEGLMLAMNKFDPKYKVRFCTYAGHWVNMCMRKVQKGPVRTPADKAAPKYLGEEKAPQGMYMVDLYELLEEDDDKASLLLWSRFLSERERYILEHSYALSSKNFKSLKDIGKRLNLSSERVRQIRTEAVNKLRKWCQF
jgi:RNA polymerase sigma factor (sigma-70 family)